MAWLTSVRIGLTSWRTVPLLFSSCLTLIGALDRDVQKPFCYASSVKRCRIVKDRFRWWKEGIRYLVREFCCALHNFRVRLTSWQSVV